MHAHAELGGRFANHAELRRLLDLLKSFPTTEAADRQQLQVTPHAIFLCAMHRAEAGVNRKQAFSKPAGLPLSGSAREYRFMHRHNIPMMLRQRKGETQQW